MDINNNHSYEDSQSSTSAADYAMPSTGHGVPASNDFGYQPEPGPAPPAIYGAADPEVTTPTAGPPASTYNPAHVLTQALNALAAAMPFEAELLNYLNGYEQAITPNFVARLEFVLSLLITALRSTSAEIQAAEAIVAQREGELRQQEDAKAALNAELPIGDEVIIQYVADNEGLRGEIRQLQSEHRGSREEARRLRQEHDRLREEIQSLRQSQQRFVLAGTQFIQLSDPQRQRYLH